MAINLYIKLQLLPSFLLQNLSIFFPQTQRPDYNIWWDFNIIYWFYNITNKQDLVWECLFKCILYIPRYKNKYLNIYNLLVQFMKSCKTSYIYLQTLITATTAGLHIGKTAHQYVHLQQFIYNSLIKRGTTFLMLFQAQINPSIYIHI